MTTLEGHCFCGAIFFQVEGPEKFACFCYCHSCQRASGAPVVSWATYPKDTFVVTNGQMRWRESSPGVTRGHCADCGSTISYETVKRPGQIDITLNALDDSDRPELRAHIFTEDKAPWMMIGDELPVYAKNVQ